LLILFPIREGNTDFREYDIIVDEEKDIGALR
jgi:hypothetical protein